MAGRIHRGAAWGAVAVGALCLAGCAPDRGIEVSNNSAVSVTVTVGDDDLGEIASDGGIVLLDVTGCYDGPVVVTYADGRVVEVDTSLCPDDRLVVGEGTARVATSGTA